MIMWKVVIWKIVRWVFASLPIETILARCFTLAIEKVTSPDDLTKIQVTVQHINESTALMTDIIADAQVTPDEVVLLKSELSQLRAKLLGLWAAKKSGKALEAKINAKVAAKAQKGRR